MYLYYGYAVRVPASHPGLSPGQPEKVKTMRKTQPKQAAATPEKATDNPFLPKPKFRVYGEEMIEKAVKPSGNSGRVYLPPEWVGKNVKIIRLD